MWHYHIRWANGKLDWEAFKTEDDAKGAAQQLARIDESYIIEHVDGDCPRCVEAVSRRSI